MEISTPVSMMTAAARRFGWNGSPGQPKGILGLAAVAAVPVADDVILCRFIRPHRDHWSVRDQRLKPGAFKDIRGDLSVWDVARLEQHSVSVADLLIEALAGCGQAQHTAGDYRQLATEAAAAISYPLQVAVERRTGDEFVAEPWRQWSYAHIQVETADGGNAAREREALYEFRRLLALNARLIVPPDWGN